MKKFNYVLNLGRVFKLKDLNGEKLTIWLKNKESINLFRELLKNKNISMNILKDRNKIEIIDVDSEILYQFKTKNIY